MKSRNYWKCLNIDVNIPLEIAPDFLFLSQKAYKKDPEGFWNNKPPLRQELHEGKCDWLESTGQFPQFCSCFKIKREHFQKRHTWSSIESKYCNNLKHFQKVSYCSKITIYWFILFSIHVLFVTVFCSLDWSQTPFVVEDDLDPPLSPASTPQVLGLRAGATMLS